MYACIAGCAPQAANERYSKDTLVPAMMRWEGEYSDRLLEIIDWCLNLNHFYRPQSVFALQKALVEKLPKHFDYLEKVLDGGDYLVGNRLSAADLAFACQLINLQHGRESLDEDWHTDFRRDYDTLKQSWGGFTGYDAWVRQANNASFGAQAAYDQWVPAFDALFEREGRDFARFYDAVRALAGRPKEERHAALRELAPTAMAVSDAIRP